MVEITLADDSSSGSFPQGPARLDTAQDLDHQLGPPGSGGLLAALHLWRQMLVEGPEKFGNAVYYGTAPFDGQRELAEIMLATRNVAEIRLTFSPTGEQLLAFEMVADATDDGCELRFSDYRAVGQQQLPHRVEVRRGDEVLGQIQWQQIELTSSTEEKKS